ncbi:MAG: Endoribonuclease toxin ChpB [Mycoplasmataceae bacterium]|nr:MAG: Endoribonuclease toxin ChpB [Mycoplasmataceae bacterium]
MSALDLVKNNVRRGEVYLAIGTEIQKIRPAVIISIDRFNQLGVRFLVVPFTSSTKETKIFEISVIFNSEKGKIIVDHLRLKSCIWRFNLLVLEKINEKLNRITGFKNYKLVN